MTALPCGGRRLTSAQPLRTIAADGWSRSGTGAIPCRKTEQFRALHPCYVRRTDPVNPYRIYRDEWAQALGKQATAAAYTCFVALPFREYFSYRSREILAEVIGAAIDEANRRRETPREFAEPVRVDVPGGATPITDDIVKGIIESHIFIGDVTFENAGVLLETGIALGTKPADQIIVV